MAIFQKTIKRHGSLSFLPSWFNLYIRPLCHTSSKAFDMSRNTRLTSMTLSKEVKISWMIDRSWLLQGSPGLNPDYFGEIRLLCNKYFNMLSYMISPKNILQVKRTIDWDWTIAFFMFWLLTILNIVTIFFPAIEKNSTF